MAWLYERLYLHEGIRLYQRPDPAYTLPLLSLNIGDRHSEEVGGWLAEQDIAVRAGLHCAPLAHRQCGTLEQGTVRLAPSAFTTRADMEYVCKKLWECEKSSKIPFANA